MLGELCHSEPREESAQFSPLLSKVVRHTSLPLDVQGGIEGGLEMRVRFRGDCAIPYGFRHSSDLCKNPVIARAGAFPQLRWGQYEAKLPDLNPLVFPLEHQGGGAYKCLTFVAMTRLRKNP